MCSTCFIDTWARLSAFFLSDATHCFELYLHQIKNKHKKQSVLTVAVEDNILSPELLMQLDEFTHCTVSQSSLHVLSREEILELIKNLMSKPQP